jgi:F-type H+/Na+-transporting ATPase subunit alpha
VLYMAVNGYCDDIPVAEVRPFADTFLEAMRSKHFDLLKVLSTELTADAEEQLKRLIENYKAARKPAK